jgi:hypothetical protein
MPWSKSFLLLFFKKTGLAFFPTAAYSRFLFLMVRSGWMRMAATSPANPRGVRTYAVSRFQI